MFQSTSKKFTALSALLLGLALLACQSSLDDDWRSSGEPIIADDVATDAGAEKEGGARPGGGPDEPGPPEPDGGGVVPNEPCAEGTFSSGGDCMPWRVCEPGTRVSEEGSPESNRKCEGCASGTFTDEANANECENWSTCEPGEFVNQTGSASQDQQCTSCMDGFTTTTNNAGACLPLDACPSGTVQIAPGEGDDPPECEACEPGNFCAGGDSAAHPCPDEEWDHDGDPATDCILKTNCAPGSFVESSGDSTTDRSCSACDSGTFTLETNAMECQAWSSCAPGSFVESSGDGTSDQTCNGCASGSFSAEANLASCEQWTQCQPGEFVDVPGTATSDQACEDCPEDSSSSTLNAASCLSNDDCPAGTEQTAPGTDTAPPDCSDCMAGEYCAGSDTPAVECSGGTWDHDEDPATPCAEHTQCLAGTYVAQAGDSLNDQVCSACSAGSFSVDVNVLSCQAWRQCEPGTYVQAEGSSTSNVSCVGCPSGSFSSGTNTATCMTQTNCQPGQYVSNPGSASMDRSCAECPDGQYSASINAGSCVEANACAPGTVEVAPATDSAPAECEPCSPGTFCAGGGAPEVACSSGTWDDDTDPATPCVNKTDCAPGQHVQSNGNATTNRSCSACASNHYSTTTNAMSCMQWSNCSAGSYVSVMGTASTNRQCSNCPSSHFSSTSNASSCTAWATCAAPSFRQSGAPSTTTNRQCTACPTGQITANDNDASCFTPVFQMSSGEVVMEAEHFHAKSSNGSSDSWQEKNDSNMSGGKGMEVAPVANNNEWSAYGGVASTSPRMDFNVNFTSTGQFWIFVRGDAGAGSPESDNSCWAGLDGDVFGTHFSFAGASGVRGWSSQGPININATGNHVISLWAREDGFIADKIVVKNNQNAISGSGPAESSQSQN